MNDIPLWAQLVVAILGSGTVGGIAGAFSSSFASRQKIKELELTEKQKLEANYHANISLHISTLYIPINAGVSTLLNKFNNYRWSSNSNSQQAEADFRLVCEKFIAQTLEIFDQGMDIYLTEEVERQLSLFTFFLRNSLDYPSKSGIWSRINYVRVRGFGFLRIRYAPIHTLTFRVNINHEGAKLTSLVKKAVLWYSSPNITPSP